MGKSDKNLQQQQSSSHESERSDRYGFFCRRCSVAVSRISRQFNFKCLFVLILSLGLLVSVVFWILPSRISSPINSYDAAGEIKLEATVQVYFKLQMPVSQLIPLIGKLEYNIYGEIGVPNSKVAVLSIHPSGFSNFSKVVFGVLPDPINSMIDPVSLSLLRSSLVEIFLQQTNLTLTNSTFGLPSELEILKFPGGITVIPQSFFSGNLPQNLFNFTLNNSMSEILGKSVQLKDQLEFGLHLEPYENVFLQITNALGSTVDPPVIVQASILSDIGRLLPQRLRQLAQTIADSPAKNLGLDNSDFGNVRSVILSSYLNRELHASPPGPSPAPSPELDDYAEPSISPSPALSTSPNAAPSPSKHDYPSSGSPRRWPCHYFHPVNCPGPSIVTADPPQPCLKHTSAKTPIAAPSHSNPTPNAHPVGLPPNISPELSPLAEVSYRSTAGTGLMSSSFAPPPVEPSHAVGLSCWGIWLLVFSELLTSFFLCCSN